MGKATGKGTASAAPVQDAYTGKLKLKVSKNGAVQLDGMRRFPITLYRDEFEAILNRADTIRAFMAANSKALKTKADKAEENGNGGDYI